MRLAILLVVGVVCALAYKPVICMHGFAVSSTAGTYHDFDDILSWLAKYHPGQIAISLNINNGYDSTRPMWEQLAQVTALIKSTVNNESFADGYHFLGHSQGGLMLRSVIETWSEHNVDTYVSMAGVHGGFYGVPDHSNMVNSTDMDAFTDLLYTKEVQHHFSMANWWRDPKDYDRFLKECIYLPVIDNTVVGNTSAEYKTNFMNVNTMAFFGSPQDGTLQPWATSHFEFWGEDGTIQPLTEQQVYIDDTFGLQSMLNSGQATIHTVPGIEHGQWLFNETNFVEFILPYLV